MISNINTNANTDKRRYKHHIRLSVSHMSCDEGVVCIECTDDNPMAYTASTLPDGCYRVQHLEGGYGISDSIVWGDDDACSGYPLFIRKRGDTVTANVIETDTNKTMSAELSTWSSVLYGTRQELSAYWMFLNDSVEEL